MAKNCWEHYRCGREPGGSKVDELGVCPAATAEVLDGINRGRNGGRCCWQVAGTLCEGRAQGTFAQKALSCLLCDFFRKVREEEGEGFQMSGGSGRSRKAAAGERPARAADAGRDRTTAP
jgi:hypothetical protein